MSATITVPRVATPAPGTNSGQAKRLAIAHTRDMLKTIGFAVLIGIAISALLAALGAIFNWGDNGIIRVDDQESGIMVTLNLMGTWIGIPLGAAAISAFVHQIVVSSGYTRVPLANGATRKNLLIANLTASAVGAIAVGVVAAIVALVENLLDIGATPSVMNLAGLTGMDIATLLGTGVLGMFAMLLFGLAAGIIFIRFHWIIGVVALVLVVMAIPGLAERWDWGWYRWLTSFEAIPHMLLAALAGGAYAAMLRGVEVP